MNAEKVLRLPEYAVDRKQARDVVSSVPLSHGDSVILDLRDMTFAGASFSSEIGSRVSKSKPSEVILRGGDKRSRRRLIDYLTQARVNVLPDESLTA